MATHSSIPTRKIPLTEEKCDRLQSTGLQKARDNSAHTQTELLKSEEQRDKW